MTDQFTTKEPAKTGRHLSRFGSVWDWIALAPLVLLTLVHYQPPPLLFILEPLAGNQVVRILLLCFGLLLLLVFLSRKHRLPALVTGLATLILLLELVYLFPVHRKIEQLSTESIGVMTFNTGWNWNIKLLGDHAAISPIDIICSQEVGVQNLENSWIHKHLFNAGYDHAWCWESSHDEFYRLWILVQGEILETRVIHTQGQHDVRNSFLAKVVVHADTFHVLNLHLEPVLHPGDNLFQRTGPRWQQAKNVAAVLDSLGDQPVIVCGDMNATPTHRTLRPIRSRLQDTWLEAGTGLGATWNRRRPVSRLFRIDHIYQQGFTTEYASPVEFGFSDHYPHYVVLKPE